MIWGRIQYSLIIIITVIIINTRKSCYYGIDIIFIEFN